MNVSMLDYLTTLSLQKNRSFARIYSFYPISKKLSFSSMLCMGIINSREGGCSATDLKSMSCYDKALISRMLSDLQDNGYIVRNPEDDNKKRGMRYILSDEGRMIAEKMTAMFIRFSHDISDDIPKEDLKTFLEVSAKLIENMVRYEKELEDKMKSEEK